MLQTAVSAALAWYLAQLVWGHPAPLFAAIAAIIVSSTSLGQQRRRATELALGVAVGIFIADVLARGIGTGGWQIAVLVVLAMSTALLVGGGPELVTEAGVSALLLATVQVPDGGVSPDRFLDALMGGAVSLLVNAILFPVNPILAVARASQPVFLDLGSALDATARGLERGDIDEARAGLERARGLDDEIERLYEAIALGQDTARLAPAHRRAHGQLRLYGDAVHQLDLAVHNTRVLARAAVGYVRDGARAPEAVVIAVRELSEAVRELACQLEEPERASVAGETAWRAARRATALLEVQPADCPPACWSARYARRLSTSCAERAWSPPPPSARSTRTPPSTRLATPTPRTDRSHAHERRADSRSAGSNIDDDTVVAPIRNQPPGRQRHWPPHGACSRRPSVTLDASASATPAATAISRRRAPADCTAARAHRASVRLSRRAWRGRSRGVVRR